MEDLESLARAFATLAHGRLGQRRKYTNEEYIVHPAEVADLVRTVPHTPEMLAAAWLHDVVEDCGVALDAIRADFGERVAELVGWLTAVSRPTDGDRAARKALDLAHTAAAPAAAKTIKCADMISNARTIVEYDPGFARTYIGEKRRTLEAIPEADPVLLARAWAIIEKAEIDLAIRR